MWSIYQRPNEPPCARRFRGEASGPKPTNYFITGPIEVLRKTFKDAGLMEISYNPTGDPMIIETWF